MDDESGESMEPMKDMPLIRLGQSELGLALHVVYIHTQSVPMRPEGLTCRRYLQCWQVP